MNKLAEEYKKETGKEIHTDLMGTICVTIDYVHWLENYIIRLKKELNGNTKRNNMQQVL